MSKRNFLRSISAASLAAAVFVTSSAMALAADKTPMGELIVSGAEVSVNGEAANTGRTVFSSNTITTPADASAIINLGKLGQVELAPNSSMNLNFDENGISGELLSGKIKVASSENVAANIKTQTGTVIADAADAKVFSVAFDANKTNVVAETGTVKLNEAGKTSTVGKAQADDNDGFFGSSAGYAILFGGAAAVLIFIAASGSNDVQLAGNTVVVSATR